MSSVLGGRLELPRVAPLVPKTSAYTNSAIPALKHYNIKSFFVVRNNWFAVANQFSRPSRTLWLQIIFCRHRKFSQPVPRGFAYSQNIAAVRTAKKSAAVQIFLNAVRPVGIEPTT